MYGLQHFQRCAAEMLLTCVLSAVKVQAALRKTIVVVLFSPLAEINECDLVEPLARDLSDGDERLPLIRAALAERYRGQFLNGTFSNSRLDDLVHAISDWLCVARMRRATVTVHRGHDPATGRFKDITAQLTDSIGGGAPASVHVVAIGMVPRDVFNEWYATSDLPGLIEGQATSSMLNSFGRPFLQILRADHVIKNGYVGALPNKDYATIANDAHETALLVRDAHVERCLRSETDFSPSNFLSSVDRVANFLLLSADSGSEHANYFQAVGKYFSRNIHDKLLIGLLALREVVRADDLCVGADAEPNDAGVRLDGLA